MNIDYARPMLADQPYTLIGSILQSGRQRTLVRATVSDSSGRLRAQANASMTPNREQARPA
ncbi:hypothetical protein [Streptacidiphilus sp. PAMC 29251]